MNRRALLKFASLGIAAAGGGVAAFRFRPADEGSSDRSEVVHADQFTCTGDSWTSGNQDGTGVTYPALLGEALPWASVTNDGHAGWTSTEIAARWGVPFTLGPFAISADVLVESPVTITAPSASYRTNTAIEFGWSGEVRLPDGTVVVGKLRHRATSAAAHEGWSFARAVAGHELSVPEGSQFVCTEMDERRGDCLIISMGRNNFGDPDVVVRDVRAILDTRNARAPYAVLGVSTSVNENAESSSYMRIRSTNAALKSAFPEAFSDVRGYLIDRGLAVTGTIPSGPDLDAVSGDTIPPALMIPAGDHPNSNGYKVIAACVLDTLEQSEALGAASSGIAGLDNTAVGCMIWSADDIASPFGATIDRFLDRARCSSLLAAGPTATPTLYRDSDSNRSFLSFDGIDDYMCGETNGDVYQPFTVVAKVRFRDLRSDGQGIVWSYGSPGATLSVTTTGRLVLNAGSNVVTPAGAVSEGTPTTLAGVANGSRSAVGTTMTPLVTGDAGAEGLVTQVQVGYYYDKVPRYASIDLFELRFYPWALSETHVAAIAGRMN